VQTAYNVLCQIVRVRSVLDQQIPEKPEHINSETDSKCVMNSLEHY